MMNIFLDTNFVLDLILPNRPRKQIVKDKIKNLSLEYDEINFFVSAKSVADIYYISRKYILKNEVDFVIKAMIILDSTAAACNFAICNTDKHDDIEDIMQIACSNENKTDMFITADPKLVENYSHLFKPKTKIILT